MHILDEAIYCPKCHKVCLKYMKSLTVRLLQNVRILTDILMVDLQANFHYEIIQNLNIHRSRDRATPKL